VCVCVCVCARAKSCRRRAAPVAHPGVVVALYECCRRRRRRRRAQGVAHALNAELGLELLAPEAAMATCYDGDGSHFIVHRDNTCDAAAAASWASGRMCAADICARRSLSPARSLVDAARSDCDF
jgi:hypothetical protein